MTAAQPDTPTPQVPSVATAPTHGNRLAIASFVLAFTPLIAWVVNQLGLAYVLLSFVVPLTDSIFFPTVVALYFAGLLGSLAAVVTGGMALGRAGRYPPQRARRGFAIAGLVLGILGILVLGFVGLVFYLFLQACSHGC